MGKCFYFTVEAVNSFALLGLDKLEERFPVLLQPTDEVSVKVRKFFFFTFFGSAEAVRTLPRSRFR